MAAGKYEDIYNFYSDDCKLMPPGQEIIVGKEGIEISHAVIINILRPDRSFDYCYGRSLYRNFFAQ